ncbi:DJ-1/PfpI family protein (plasmid) [Burkholderia sp. M6-3]
MKKVKVGLVVFPGFRLLDIAGPKDAFAEVKVLSLGECEYEMLTVGTTRGTVQSSSGLTTVPDRTIFDQCPEFDTVIVPGGLRIFDAFDDPALSGWLKDQYKQCRRGPAICNGLFALGSAGLLDNKVVTTHWMDVPRLAASFPRAKIEPDTATTRWTDFGVPFSGVATSIRLTIVTGFVRVSRWAYQWIKRSGGSNQLSRMIRPVPIQ